VSPPVILRYEAPDGEVPPHPLDRFVVVEDGEVWLVVHGAARKAVLAENEGRFLIDRASGESVCLAPSNWLLRAMPADRDVILELADAAMERAIAEWNRVE
jgi:hypothetical protein